MNQREIQESYQQSGSEQSSVLLLYTLCLIRSKTALTTHLHDTESNARVDSVFLSRKTDSKGPCHRNTLPSV